jgi:phosphopantothenoylcysteine decarboxylase/phosphopantothenate--cysteine ligase
MAANVGGREAPGVRRVDVETAAELADAVDGALEDTHVLLMAAAVADFTPEQASEGKVVREGSGGLDLHLVETKDILAVAGAKRKPDQVIIGFAAEHGPEAIERARAKLERKGADAIVFNDVSRGDIGFDSERNEVTIVESERETLVEQAPKGDVADAILDRVEAIRAAKGALT